MYFNSKSTLHIVPALKTMMSKKYLQRKANDKRRWYLKKTFHFCTLFLKTFKRHVAIPTNLDDDYERNLNIITKTLAHEHCAPFLQCLQWKSWQIDQCSWTNWRAEKWLNPSPDDPWSALKLVSHNLNNLEHLTCAKAIHTALVARVKHVSDHKSSIFYYLLLSGPTDWKTYVQNNT